MKKQKKLSIIIPHKDIPYLLQRCLDPISSNDLIALLVVDDKSVPIYKEQIRIKDKK